MLLNYNSLVNQFKSDVTGIIHVGGHTGEELDSARVGQAPRAPRCGCARRRGRSKCVEALAQTIELRAHLALGLQAERVDIRRHRVDVVACARFKRFDG